MPHPALPAQRAMADGLYLAIAADRGDVEVRGTGSQRQAVIAIDRAGDRAGDRVPDAYVPWCRLGADTAPLSHDLHAPTNAEGGQAMLRCVFEQGDLRFVPVVVDADVIAT